MNYEPTERDMERVDKMRLAQGLPLKVTDPTIMRFIADQIIANRREMAEKASGLRAD